MIILTQTTNSQCENLRPEIIIRIEPEIPLIDNIQISNNSNISLDKVSVNQTFDSSSGLKLPITTKR